MIAWMIYFCFKEHHMHKIVAVFAICFFVGAGLRAQMKVPGAEKPRLVVGIVVDQMRWDYLQRFRERFAANGGFLRMMQQGYSYDNLLIPYVPTVTACGHTCIYTGSVPSIHGITGNHWWDARRHKDVYCASDDSVQGVGVSGSEGRMSPKNMQVTTIGDELRMATNFRGKSIGIALKDRGAIFPAGHSANGAYWYDNTTGRMISSSYYDSLLPDWVTSFNDRKLPDEYYRRGWKTMYPLASYTSSTTDQKAYESKPYGTSKNGFPYDFSEYIGKNYGILYTTPYGNELTYELAKAAVTAEQLGKDSFTDLLAVSFSSTDAVGHSFGPNSIEVEDMYLRLDSILGAFFRYLDVQVGAGRYVAFLSADHAVAHVAGYLTEHKIPGGTAKFEGAIDRLKQVFRTKYGSEKLFDAESNSQLFFNHDVIDSLRINPAALVDEAVRIFRNEPYVSAVIPASALMTYPMNEQQQMRFANSYFHGRSGDVYIILKSGYQEGYTTGTGHSAWYNYDAHIPMVWYGGKVPKGRSRRTVYMTDIAPTIAAMLDIQMPSGSVGEVLVEVVK
jgi:predicted AlkP superfamily pyrophosphatase or phosphodiesterase